MSSLHPAGIYIALQAPSGLRAGRMSYAAVIPPTGWRSNPRPDIQLIASHNDCSRVRHDQPSSLRALLQSNAIEVRASRTPVMGAIGGFLVMLEMLSLTSADAIASA